MAMKTDFEDANFITSPFVDEIANQGHVTGPFPDPGFVDPQDKSGGTRGTPLTKKEKEFMAASTVTPKPKKAPGTVSGFAGPGLENRADFINEQLLGLKKKK